MKMRQVYTGKKKGAERSYRHRRVHVATTPSPSFRPSATSPSRPHLESFFRPPYPPRPSEPLYTPEVFVCQRLHAPSQERLLRRAGRSAASIFRPLCLGCQRARWNRTSHCNIHEYSVPPDRHVSSSADPGHGGQLVSYAPDRPSSAIPRTARNLAQVLPSSPP